MSNDVENENLNTEPVQLNGWMVAGYKNAQLNYFLYLLAFFLGITAIVGVVFAYVNRDDANSTVYSHYTYQIRTFWMGLGYSVICLILTFVFIGILLFMLLSVWWLIRSIKGLMAISRKEPIANPETWLF